MGCISGDKGRFNRDRRKKLANRVAMRALGKKLRAEAAKAAKSTPSRP